MKQWQELTKFESYILQKYRNEHVSLSSSHLTFLRFDHYGRWHGHLTVHSTIHTIWVSLYTQNYIWGTSSLCTWMYFWTPTSDFL